MTKKILKKLSAKKKIPGSKKPLIFDRIKGRNDFRNSQVCTSDSGDPTTPWINEKIKALSVYEHYVYNDVDKALAPVADKIAVECQELMNLDDVHAGTSDNEESRVRMEAYKAAKAANNEQRRKEIFISLAGLRSELEVVDTALKHHMQRAENETRKHISAYWSGVLKAAASDKMPVEPLIVINEPEGKNDYLRHYNTMIDRINEALGGETNEAA